MLKFESSEIAKKVTLRDFLYIDDYTGINRKRRVVFSDKFGYKYDVDFYGFKKGYVPEFVSTANPFSIENIGIWLKNENKSYKILEGNSYINAHKKLKFYCVKCDDDFEISWDSLYHGNGCGKCRGFQVGKNNNLAYLRPDLAKEWDYEKNEIRPDDVTLASNKKVYWVCKDGHSWNAVIYSRTINNLECPYCSGFYVTNKNRLSILYPEIASEWHPTLNGDLTPDDVSYGSHKKIWWLCSICEHEWKTEVYHRSDGRSCPECASKQTESKTANELKQYFKENYDAIPEYKIFINPETGYFLPYDIYISCGDNPELNGIYIEVHGIQHYKLNNWHKQLSELNETTPEEEFKYQKKKDRMKRKFAKKSGTYIEIDLRKVKTTEEAISYIEDIINKMVIL